jgi:hypothetical protein
MVRPASWTRPAGAIPAWVIAREPGSRLRSVGEVRRAWRGVNRLLRGGASVRAAASSAPCSLVTGTNREQSRTRHVEGPSPTDWQDQETLPFGSFRDREGGAHAWPGHGTGRTRLPSLASKDRSYEPVVKSSGGKRESDGVVVAWMEVHHNASGGTGPDSGHAGRAGRCKHMTRTAWSNLPDGRMPAVHVPHTPRAGYGHGTGRPGAVVSPCTQPAGATAGGWR